MMDINEFIKEEQPIHRSSKLDPYRSDILKLYGLGYNLNQILKFLELNDLVISKPALQRFIKTRLADKATVIPAEKEKSPIARQPEPAKVVEVNNDDDEVARRPSWATKVPMSELI